MGPRGDPTEWSSWGEEAQWRERALPLAAKRAIRNLCRRRGARRPRRAIHLPGNPRGRAYPAGAPLFVSKAVGKPPGPAGPGPGAHGGGGLYGQGKYQPCIAARRRCKFQIIRFAASGKAHSFHCTSSPHRTRFAGLRRGPHCCRHRRCRASGSTHRDYPASLVGCCAVPAWPVGPPLVPCLR